MKLARATWILIVIAASLSFVAGLWRLDVSVSSMVLGGNIASIMGGTDPMFGYHLGIIQVVASFAVVMVIAIHHIFKGLKEVS